MRNILIVFISLFVWIGNVSAEDYHVMSIVNDGSTNQVTVVFHIPVPIENNAANYSLRSALSEYVGGADFQSSYPNTQAAELLQLQNGELYEHLESVQVEDSSTNLQKQTQIDVRFGQLSTSALNKIKNILEFWGLDRDVP